MVQFLFYTLSINKYDHKKKMQIELQNKTDWIWNELRDFESYFIKVLLWILSAHTVWCSFLLGNCSPEIVMLRSANAKHITTSFGSIFAVYQSAYHPRLKPALAHHTQLITKATENRKKNRRCTISYTHTNKQRYDCIVCCRKILRDGSKKDTEWRRFKTIESQLISALLSTKFNVTVWK